MKTFANTPLALVGLVDYTHSFFQSGVQFSTGNARGTALSEVYPANTNNEDSSMWTYAVLSQDSFSHKFKHFLAYFSMSSHDFAYKNNK